MTPGTFYIRRPDWCQEAAYWAELQAEEDLAKERKEEDSMTNDDKGKDKMNFPVDISPDKAHNLKRNEGTSAM